MRVVVWILQEDDLQKPRPDRVRRKEPSRHPRNRRLDASRRLPSTPAAASSPTLKEGEGEARHGRATMSEPTCETCWATVAFCDKDWYPSGKNVCVGAFKRA